MELGIDDRNLSLRIGVFGIRSIPSTYSGYETFMTALLPKLADGGHEVTVFCRGKEMRGAAQFRGVRRTWTPSVPTKQLDTLTHGFTSAVAAAFKRFDVVLVCNIANAPYCLVLERLGTRVVLNTDGQEWLRGKWGVPARRYFHWCAKIGKRSATSLVSDCNAMARIYEAEFQSASTVIPYSWNTLGEDESTQQTLASFGLEKRQYSLTGGRLVPENNVAEIVELYLHDSEAPPIVVLGEANYDSPVVQRLKELSTQDGRVKLLGHIPHRQQYRTLLAESFLYLHGHSIGGMNPSLVEAMGAGSMIAALDTPFNREVLGDAGMFFDLTRQSVGSAVHESLQANLAGDDRARQESVARARERYGLDEVSRAYEELLLTTARQRGRTSQRIRTRWSDLKEDP